MLCTHKYYCSLYSYGYNLCLSDSLFFSLSLMAAGREGRREGWEGEREREGGEREEDKQIKGAITWLPYTHTYTNTHKFIYTSQHMYNTVM